LQIYLSNPKASKLLWLIHIDALLSSSRVGDFYSHEEWVSRKKPLEGSRIEFIRIRHKCFQRQYGQIASTDVSKRIFEELKSTEKVYLNFVNLGREHFQKLHAFFLTCERAKIYIDIVASMERLLGIIFALGTELKKLLETLGVRAMVIPNSYYFLAKSFHSLISFMSPIYATYVTVSRRYLDIDWKTVLGKKDYANYLVLDEEFTKTNQFLRPLSVALMPVMRIPRYCLQIVRCYYVFIICLSFYFLCNILV
jgi:hypothetical protein